MAEGEPENPEDSLLAQRVAYQEICASIRAYTNLEFAQMTIYVALSGGLLAGWLSTASNAIVDVSIATVGILIGVCFWFMSRRVSEYWDEFITRAIRIERTLGVANFSAGAPKKKFWKNRTSLSVVYWTLIGSFGLLLVLSAYPAWMEVKLHICR